MYLRGDLSSFRLLFDFFDEDAERELLERSVFELELLDDDDDLDDDFEPPPPLTSDLPDGLVEDLVGDREFLCLWLSLRSKSFELLLLFT